jgi:Flp pilus assembly protein TadG
LEGVPILRIADELITIQIHNRFITMPIPRIQRRNCLAEQRRGVTTVEVAITFPILMFLILLVFDVSRMMMVHQCLGYAAQEGSRHASLATSISQSEVESITKAALQAAVPNAASTVTVTVSPSLAMGMNSGTPMIVNAQVRLSDVSWLSGNMLQHLGDPMLTASAVQERE